MDAVLGIDTSCYTTSAALAGEGFLLSERKLLPVAPGQRGLRQSEAVFAHIRQLGEVTERLFERARAQGEPVIRAVCVSASPVDGEDSYMPVFRTGMAFAETIAHTLGVKVYYTTHQRGHLRAAREYSGLEGDRFLALHLSGGTTDTMLSEGDRLVPLLRGLDLHAGQLVDRTGVVMGLPFPAGPYLEELARGAEDVLRLPVSMDDGGCHLSGAENALISAIRQGESRETVAKSVYDLLCRTVLRLLADAAEKTGESRALLFGGVASSALLREMLLERNQKRRLGLRLYFGRPELSGDNAAGVALIGFEKYKSAETDK